MRVDIPVSITLKSDRDFYFGWCQAADDCASVLRHNTSEEARKILKDELEADSILDDEQLERDPLEPCPASLIGWRVGIEAAFGGGG